MNRERWIALAIAAVVIGFFFIPRLGTKTEDQLTTTPTSFTGVVVDVVSSELNDVASFEVRHDGTTTTVYVRRDFDYGFPIGHLQAHLTSGDPVTIEVGLIEGKLYADSIEDA